MVLFYTSNACLGVTDKILPRTTDKKRLTSKSLRDFETCVPCVASAIIAAKKPVADHKNTSCLKKLFLLMVYNYYRAKDVGMLCASYVNNI